MADVLDVVVWHCEGCLALALLQHRHHRSGHLKCEYAHAFGSPQVILLARSSIDRDTPAALAGCALNYLASHEAQRRTPSYHKDAE